MSTPALLAIVARIRAVEQRLARAEQARVATELVKQHVHTLGNALQIVDLASAELVRRDADDSDELVAELRTAAIDARRELDEMIGIARPPPRTTRGFAVAPIVHAAVERMCGAVPSLELALDAKLATNVASRLEADELEALVYAAVIDAIPIDPGARGEPTAHVRIALFERTIQGAPWIELILIDGRRTGELAVPPLIEHLVELAGGEASASDGRSGDELAIALPVA